MGAGADVRAGTAQPARSSVSQEPLPISVWRHTPVPVRGRQSKRIIRVLAKSPLRPEQVPTGGTVHCSSGPEDPVGRRSSPRRHPTRSTDPELGTREDLGDRPECHRRQRLPRQVTVRSIHSRTSSGSPSTGWPRPAATTSAAAIAAWDVDASGSPWASAAGNANTIDALIGARRELIPPVAGIIVVERTRAPGAHWCPRGVGRRPQPSLSV